jgi:hypothetical protein
MATKKGSKKTEKKEEPVVEAPVEEPTPAPAPKAAPKASPKAAPKAKKVEVRTHAPELLEALETDLPDAEFIKQSYLALVGREPKEAELNHSLLTIGRFGRPRTDVHTDIRNSGEYQGLHGLV